MLTFFDDINYEAGGQLLSIPLDAQAVVLSGHIPKYRKYINYYKLVVCTIFFCKNRKYIKYNGLVVCTILFSKYRKYIRYVRLVVCTSTGQLFAVSLDSLGVLFVYIPDYNKYIHQSS